MGDERAPARGTNAGEVAVAEPSVADAIAEEEGTPGTRAQQRTVGRIEPFFDGAILILYIVVGGLLLALAVVALGYALVTIPKNLHEGVSAAITVLLSELLLVLILAEVLRTIITYVSTRTSSIRPFLTVAVISSVRRILSIGAGLSVGEELSRDAFNRAMIELGAEGAIILVVAIALYLFSRREGG